MKRKIVCLGDSVTEGCFELYQTSYGFDTIRDKESCYVTRLGMLLGDGWEVVNAGVSGNNSRMAMERVEKDVTALKPEFCVVCLGLNDMTDLLERHQKHMSTIFAALRENGIKPVLLTPPVACTYIHRGITDYTRQAAEKISAAQNAGNLDRIVESDRLLAKEYGTSVCDFYAFKTAQRLMGRDTTEDLSNYINHPSRDEHRIMAAMLYGLFLNCD
ncbi:MAG: hypothetical protein J5940_05985 [Clostridia bacterium]|nr:hypothetical protein [Clostridia bacterium]